MLNFVNTPLPGALRREVRLGLGLAVLNRYQRVAAISHSLAWLAPTNEPNDAFLAVGSADTFIHIISVARSGVVKLLQGLRLFSRC